VKGRITIDKELCKGCGLCVEVCRRDQIEISDQLNKKGYYPARFKDAETGAESDGKCNGCALCGLICPDVAIEVYREEKKTKGQDERAQGSDQAKDG
jgi:2-oxoglutarate ferredoxin oxidoreductase subunit delta